MHKLFVRLAISGAVAVGMGATALADGSGIELTGPGSTNLITNSSSFVSHVNLRNFTDVGNWNNQWARSGNVWVGGNTHVDGFGLGSGNAFNQNFGHNDVTIENHGGNIPFGLNKNFGGGGTIFLTGPHSFNAISTGNVNRFSSNTLNNVHAANFNNQNARSGNVVVSGNTLVTGVGGSGNAANFNSGSNDININNSTPTWSGGTWGGGSGGGVISTTGPHSFNAIRTNNGTFFNQNTTNNVSATNFNHQNATTGNVVIRDNTVVSGVGGSGSAWNSNSGENNVGISNN